jgi:very-short-patch-repair endonuclease/predicted transcriptional regulator of viral defense system
MEHASASSVDMRRLLQTRGVDALLAEVAERQHGLVTRTQLREWRIKTSAIDRRIRGGRLHPVHPGVYAVGHRVLSRQARWMAAVLACGPGAVLSHYSAAALWGMRGASGRAIEVTTPRKSRSGGAIHRHFAVLPADEMTTERGIPVATVPRTLFDLAAVSSVDVVEHALRESEYLRLHDRLSLPDLLDRYPRRRGSPIIRECLRRRAELPAGRARSWLEREFLQFLRHSGLSRPQLNVWLQVGGKRIQVDCLWPGRVVVELDGFAAHGTRTAFRADRVRDRKLRVAGYGVMRIAPEQLDEEPEEIASDLRALLHA